VRKDEKGGGMEGKPSETRDGLVEKISLSLSVEKHHRRPGVFPRQEKPFTFGCVKNTTGGLECFLDKRNLSRSAVNCRLHCWTGIDNEGGGGRETR
jgi:hypothetical protein